MKGILKNLHRYLLWAILSVVFWAWVISLITNAPAGKKLVLYADLDAMDREALSAALEQDMPERIRFVEARLFTDELFQPANVTMGDLYIVSEEQAEGYLSTFTPVDEGTFPGSSFYRSGGTAYGVCVYDEAADIRVGTSCVSYLPGQRYYLFFNADSRHLGAWNGSSDDAALRAAATFLTLP